jgi:hypothetical protein
MGLTVDMSRLAAKLRKLGELSTRALRSEHVKAAGEIKKAAKALAPYRFGHLEGDIVITELREAGGRKSFEIATKNVPYAIFMHEGFGPSGTYTLGPKSAEKPGLPGHPVGKFFINRAVAYVLDDLGYLERMQKAVRKELVETERRYAAGRSSRGRAR